MSRPSDHVDAQREGFEARDRPPRPANGPLGRVLGVWRALWRQLTSMRVALLLLLLLAIAAIPGSLVPQRTSDPNGVARYFSEQPELAPLLDDLQLFDVYSSAWFTSVYLLLFVSLVGCIVPRIAHHWRSLRSAPPRTPARLERMDAYSTVRLEPGVGAEAGRLIERAREILRARRYRTAVFDQGARGVSVSAERGYVRETGNLLFHIAMLGLILSVGIGGGFSWHGQRVLVEGQTFSNDIVSYSSFTPGQFFSPNRLAPYSMTLDSFEVDYETGNPNALGQVNDYAAGVTVQRPGSAAEQAVVRVNEPLRYAGTDVYLLGNGYAPVITVRDPQGRAVFSDAVPFLPQDANLTSLGVVKVPDGLSEQLGMIGFFYPTASELETGAFASAGPELRDPLLTLNVFTGDLGLDSGVPTSVYRLDTDGLEQIAGGGSRARALQLRPGETSELPGGLGTVTLETVPRYASFDIHSDPTQEPVLICTVLVIAGLMTSLLVPRRRVWVKAVRRPDGGTLLEYAGLARGEDPGLAAAVGEVLDAHASRLVGSSSFPGAPREGDGKRPGPVRGATRTGAPPEGDEKGTA